LIVMYVSAMSILLFVFFFFFKQKTAYEMVGSDWSSDVCSSDLHPAVSSVSICVINVIATDASGTSDPATGAASVDIPLNSRVYLTGNLASPCPQCNCGTPP